MSICYCDPVEITQKAEENPTQRKSGQQLKGIWVCLSG